MDFVRNQRIEMSATGLEDFRRHLWRQLGFLESSCHSYDQGYSDEAIRIAVVLRVLIHQTRYSTSLLTHLDATDIHLLTTCPDVPLGLDGAVVFFGLGAMADGRYLAHLDRATFRRMVPVCDWWDETVYVLGEDTTLTRREIVLAAANKDGGAHVDSTLTPAYEKLISFLQVGSWESSQPEWRDANMHFAALRQMGFELLNSPELLMQAEAPSPPAGQPDQSPAIEAYRFLMTDRVRQLIQEANQLKPHQSIVVKVIEDRGPVPEGTASAFVVAPGGREEIHLDPAKATEYTFAQDVMLAILYRTGWPVVYSTLPGGMDRDADLISQEVTRVFHKQVFDPSLINLGIDVDGCRNQMMQDIIAWPTTEVAGHDLLWASIRILEVMLWNGPHREAVVETMSAKQPEALMLARELETEGFLGGHKTKSETRAAIVRVLDYLDRWVTQQTGRCFELRKRIVVSPIFDENQLTQPANVFSEFVSFPLHIGDASWWIAGLTLKSDGFLIGRMPLEPTSTGAEPDLVADARCSWETLDLRGLLDTFSIRFGTET
jgi:hypothetical protein